MLEMAYRLLSVIFIKLKLRCMTSLYTVSHTSTVWEIIASSDVFDRFTANHIRSL